MKKIVILALEGTATTTVMGPADLFAGAGMIWNSIQGEPLKKYFDVTVVSQNGEAVKGYNGLSIDCHCGINDIEEVDLVIISSMFNIKQTLNRHQKSINWIKKMHQKGADIASICTGAFLLAQTGLLDHKKATTHWGAIHQFKEMFPTVDVDPNQILIDEGSILTSGGANAGFDLSLYLIERYYGHELALKNSKVFLQDLGRSSQTPYMQMKTNLNHIDVQIKSIQEWIFNHLDQTLELSNLAKRAGLSLRTFERRFKKATGETPLTYIQKLKVENAKNLLETTLLSFDEITYQLGYQNSGSFRKVFVKNTSLLPSEYRTKFQRYL